MGFNIKSLYKENNESNTAEKQSGFNVRSLRDQKFELKTDNGTPIGSVSYDAYKAIKNNNLDSYTPKTSEEKASLDSFKAYAQEQYEKQQEAEKQKRINSSSTFARYNINPADFDYDDLSKWAGEHNHTMHIDGSMHTYFTPNYKGGKKLSTDEEDADMEVLYQTAMNNTRAELAQKDLGAFMSGIVGMGDGISFGAISKLSDWSAKKQYEDAGLDSESFISPTQTWANTVNEHKISNIVGDIGGSLITFKAAGTLVESGLMKIPKYASLATEAANGVKKAQKVKNIIDTAATVSSTTAIGSAIQQDWKNTEWYKSVGNVLLDTTVSTLGAYVGGKLSSVVGERLGYVLQNKTNLSAAAIKGLVSGTSALTFSGTAVGLSEMKNALQAAANNTEYKPDVESIVTNMAVLAIYSGLKSYVDTKRLSGGTPVVEEKFEYFTEEDMSSPDALKKKMRQYAKEYHPDKFHGAGEEAIANATQKMQAINAEYERAKNKVAFNIISEMQKAQGDDASSARTTSEKAEATNTAVAKAVEFLNDAYATDSTTASVAGSQALTKSNTTPTDNVIVGAAVPSVVAETTPAIQNTNDFTDELSEVASAGAVAKYAPESASADVVSLENKLINVGASDVDRQKVVETAIAVESTLVGTDKSLKDVLTDTTRITGSAVTAFKQSVGTPKNYWSLFNTNLKTIAALQPKENFIVDYANTFAETLQSTDSVMSRAVVDSGIDVASAVSQYALTGNVPEEVKNETVLSRLSKAFTAITEPVLNQIDTAHITIYGDARTQEPTPEMPADTLLTNTQFEQVVKASDFHSDTVADNETITMSDGTKVSRAGDFYEAYGADARSLAKKLDLHIVQKTVNGEKVDMVGFPAYALDTYNQTLNAVTNINEQNMHVSSENTPANEDTANTDVDMVEGKILSLKHTKNVYSLFKGAMRIVVGKDIITDGFVVLPLTDESLAGVKKVIGDSAPIQENPNFDMKKFYHADNDVIIQGNPKVGEATAGNKTVKAYTFKIADAFYSCQQKFIDAFNNGKNVIKANKSINIPWTVHNENGELVALFLGLRANVTEENYNQMLTVTDIKSAEQQKKAKQSFNPSEVKTIVKGSGIPRVFEMGGSKYVTEGHFALRTDDAGIAQLNGTVIPYHSMPDGMQTISSDAIKKLLDSSYSVDVGELTPYTLESEKDAKTPPYYAFVADGIAHQYSKKFVDALKKRSTSMKLTSGGTLNSTLIVGYDADGNITGFVLPVYANGNSYVDKDGNKIPFATNDNLKNLVKDNKDVSATAVPSVTKTPESVTETPESVTNLQNKEENTPVPEEKTEYNHLYNEETVSKDFINSVNPEIESAILNIRNGNIEAVPDVVEVTELTEETIEKISDFVGFDVSGYSCKIEKDALQHIENRHGINGSHDHSLSDPKDTARMGYIVNNSDSVDWIREKDGAVKTSKKYRDKNNKPAKLVMVQKKIDGTYCVSDVVPDSKNKTIWVTSARIQKKHQDLDDNNESPKTTPENDLNASDTIIAEKTQNVNTSQAENVEQSAENTPTLTDKCELHETSHTKTGEKLWVISLKDKITSDEYKALSGIVKKVGGYYSRFAKTPDGKAIPGFIFKSKPDSEVIKVFNEFFGEAKDTNVSAITKSEDKEVKIADNTTNFLSDEERDAIKDTAVKNGSMGLNDLGDMLGIPVTNISTGDKNKTAQLQSEIDNMQKSNATSDVLKKSDDSDIIKEKEVKDGVNNVEQKSEVLAGESTTDDSGLHPTAQSSTERTAEADSGQHRDNGRELLQDNNGTEPIRPNVGNDSERVHGRNDTESSDAESGKSETEITDSTSEIIDTEAKTVEKPRPSNKGNFVITDDVAAEIDTTAPSAKDNIEAIELLLKIEDEGRPATAEEKKILAKYKGWGGIDPRRIPYELSSRFGRLFDWEQRKAMQSSMNNAFFTPTKVIDAMYNGLKRMGFRGGNVLETSMGVGNFFGRMPQTLSSKSALTGVELESYTARIAQYLYPGATVINKPFQDVAIKNGSYDLVIGNVPFGTNKLTYNKKKYNLHNYFILSSIDKVRDGGVVAAITSAGTLDSYTIDARKAIMDKADVIGCYKLPAGVFSRNADTDVQTDLLILRKRANGEKPSGDSILNVVTTKDGLRVNEYFEKHPENILGVLSKGTNAWGEITTVLDDGSFYDKLETAMKKLPKDLISGKTELKPIETIVSVSDKPRFFEKNGKIYSDDGAGTATQVTNREQTVRDYMAVRDSYKELLNAYELDKSEEDIKPLRDALSKAYDKFYKAHTAITGDGKKKIGNTKCKNNTFLEADADYYLVSGLEYYNAKDGKFEKSALFEKDTLRKKRVTSVDAASDALAVSLNESGHIDFERMKELTGKTETQLAEELKGEIVLTPEGEYVLTDIYLSGNIYAKLEAVKGKPEFKEQQAMLEAVLPTPKDASSITVKLGANYIEPSYIQDFVTDIFKTRIEVSKDNSGRWSIEGVRRIRYGDILNVKYGCKAFNAIQLLEKILNDSEITATKRISDGTKQITVADPEQTDIARQKAEDIKAEFESWIFSDSDRRADIVDKYNRTYNNYRPLDYEHIAEKLSFDSMDSTLKAKLYPHQKKGIARFLFGGNILFAHGVGTGKTFEMIASVMEAKRMGLINKAAMVVPNNKVVDFKRDIAQAYPNAKVLVIDTANKKRQTMLGLVNSNDWDIVLIARTTFTKIPVSNELQANYVNQQLEDLEYQISLAQNDRDVSRRQLKGLITQRDNLEQKLKDLSSDTVRDENSVEFEKLGIDCICVDEAHNYKSILTPTKLDIKGLVNRNNAQMANDMLMKLDYMRSINGKIIFGTGTPITNTVSEIYNMMRMVRPDILEDAGIHSLDEWVNIFAKIETNTEIGIDNKIKTKSTQIIRSFINVSEMIGMFRQFADIVFTDDVVKNLPKTVYNDVKLDGTAEHRQIEEEISSIIANTPKAELLRTYGQVMAMADAAAVDLRMLSGAESEHNIFKDYSLDELDYADSKINTMCGLVFDEYKASKDIKGTQIIFCDKGSGSGTVYSFNLHKDIMKKLIEKGIPKDEIVIVKDQSDAQLEALYEKVNNGEVRVLIGTSQKMAEGLNVQKRVVAIHHPTVTYKPSDWEQGNARGIRAGNINPEVHIYRYLQENTFDSHKWQAVDRKGEMIRRALRGEQVAEMEDIGADEDSGAGVDAATAMAITSGNPLVKEKIDIDKEVIRLKTLERNYKSEMYRYQDAIAKNPGTISRLTTYLDRLAQDIALRDKYGEKAEMIIKGKKFDKQGEANKALGEAVKSAPKNGNFIKLGEYNGFDIMFKGDTGGIGYTLVLKGANEYTVEYAGGSGNNIARIAGVLNRLTAEQTKQQARLEQFQKDLEFAKTEVNKPFEKEAELSAALEKQKDITYRYEHYSEQKQSEPAETDTTSDEVLSSRDLNLSEDTVLENRWATERVEDNKVKGVNIADIVRSISEKFGIPIATGKVTDREASGIYKAKPETIRTRIANNLPTISHELGHHLCKKYGLDGLESVAILRNSISQEYLDMYDDDATKNKESVAEFIRSYLKNTNEAVRLCPEFYAEFIQALSKEDLKAVNEIASAVNEYLSYNISERYDAAITSSQKKEKIPFREKWEKFYTNWVDSFHPQKEAVDYVQDATGRTLSGKGNAYVLATNSLNAHAVANYLVCEGFRNLSGELIDAKSFIDCIGIVDSKDVKLLDKYLVLRHSLEWIAPEQDDVTAKRVFADDTLENVEEIKKQMAEIEDTHPEIKTAAENLYEYQNNVLKYFVIPAGGMTRETLETLNRKYPSYVPFYRAVGNKRSGMAKGTFANQRSPIMRAKGSGDMIISPTESIIRNTEKMVKFALRNQVMRIWANYADNVDGFGQFMEKVSPDMIPHFTDISKQKESFTEALQHKLNAEDYFAISDMFDEIFGDAVTDFTPIANANKKIVTVLQSGVPSYYQIHDNAFYTSVAELSPQQTSGLLKVMNSVMQPMKLLITQNNPIFAVTNAIRDYFTAYKLSEVNNPVTFAAQYVKALATIIENGESYKQYKAMGVGHSSELSANIENIKSTLRRVSQKDMGKARRLAYSIFRHPVETVASFNDLIESVPRFAEFQRTLANGGDLQEATFNASDLTTNFKRSGSGDTAKAVNKIIMFNNAAIQGLDKAFRTITNKDIKKRYKTLLKWLLNALIMGILGYLYNNEVDEEGYKNLSAYKKNNFYNYALGDGKFISLPKPRENALLDTLTERTFEYLLNENEEAFYDFGTYLGQQLLPPMLPDTIDPVNAAHSVLGSAILGGLVDVGFNQDFKGTPIEGAYDKYIPSNERYTESTSKVAYALGQTQLARDIDMSPKKIDHLISSYTGILGQVNKALFPINPERKDKSVGLRNKFISDSNYSTDVLNKMYENEEKAEKVFQYAGTIDKAVEYEQNAIITSYISGMNKAIKALPESEQRNGRVYLLQALNRWDYNNTTSQTNMLSRLDGEKVSDSVIITGLPKSTIEWTVYETNSNGNRIKRSDGSYLRTKCEYQMTPQEYDAYIKDYLNLVDKYRTWQGNNISNTADYTAALEETSTEVKKVLNKKYQQKYYGKAQKSVKD